MKKFVPQPAVASGRRRRVFAISILGILIASSASIAFFLSRGAAQQTDTTEELKAKSPAKPAVILLTGFEPFGKKKEPNPSWEGIKKLDGRSWKGYQLVCKLVPVVWGAPRSHLPDWIAEYQPAAVFAFGQGGKGSFTIECVAVNERAEAKDNLGAKPSKRTIVDGGPFVYTSSLAYENVVRDLAKKGHAVRLSLLAGHYLCEEMLYTLENLKTAQQVKGPVAFCHVPPLKSDLNGHPVTAEMVEGFVLDMLETSYVNMQDKGGGPAPADSDAKARDLKDVREFVERYFRTWSEQDMRGYDACFLPEACIQQIGVQGELTTMMKRPFVASQREYHATAPQKTIEVPVSMEIHFEGKLARAAVFWKLTAGPRTETGYDHFLLMKSQAGWRIVNLTFYSSPLLEKK